jgi:surface polysaccharide O-acyltransferase-like enzyme
MVALSDPPFLRLPRLAGLGPLVLGIYASHYLFVDLLSGPDNALHALPGWDLLAIALVFALSLALTGLMWRFAPTRRLVA